MKDSKNTVSTVYGISFGMSIPHTALVKAGFYSLGIPVFRKILIWGKE